MIQYHVLIFRTYIAFHNYTTMRNYYGYRYRYNNYSYRIWWFPKKGVPPVLIHL